METLRKEAVKISAQLTFEIDNQTITRTDSFKVVAKSQNYLYASFTFSAEWEDITKIAVFKSSCDSYEIYLDENDECVVPWESLMHAGNMYVSVFGGDRITTNKARVPVYATGYTENVSTTQDPTIDVYTSLINRMDNIDDHIDDSVAAALEDAKESGEFDGPKGDKGDKGDTGEISEAEFEAGLATKSNASTIAPEFSASTAYTAGSYVYKNGVLYRFTSAHTGAWTGTDAEEVTVGGEVTDLKADLSDITESVKQLPIGLPDAQKRLIISIMRNALYSVDKSGDIDALEDAFFASIPATAVTLNKTSVSLEGTESQVALVATVIPLNSTDVVVWTSSNPTIATVDSNGLVTAVGTGTCTITATAGSVSATCSVTVAMVSIVSIDAVYTQSGTVYTTDNLDSLKDDLVVTAHWSNGTTTTVDSYDYTLSGTLTAGTSTITATYAGCTDTFTVTITQKDLDSIAYENKSYRDIFMTGNLLTGTDFENGTPAGWTVHAGNPEITTEKYISASHSLKCAGTVSAQYTIEPSAAAGFGRTAGKTYFQACKMNCTRYVKGYLGFTGITGNYVGSIEYLTDGWITKYKYGSPASTEAPNRGFVGSYSNADLDGYMDDLVNICLSDMFETIPNSETILALYEEYCTLRNGGAV